MKKIPSANYIYSSPLKDQMRRNVQMLFIGAQLAVLLTVIVVCSIYLIVT